MNITEEIKRRKQHLAYRKLQGTNMDNGERLFSIIGGFYLIKKGLGGISRHLILGLQSVLAGGFLVYRGASGNCPIYRRLGRDTNDPQAITISEKVTVQAQRESVYAFWRKLSNLPLFMNHLSSVAELDDKHSTWTAKTPDGLPDLKWNAEITHEEPGRYIGWQSVEGSMVDNAGKVEFKESLNGTATDLVIEISYFPPAGSVGRGIASMFTTIFEDTIRTDIQGFRAYAEAEGFRNFAGLSDR